LFKLLLLYERGLIECISLPLIDGDDTFPELTDRDGTLGGIPGTGDLGGDGKS